MYAFQSLAAAAAFFYTTQLSLTVQLAILVITNALAAVCFFAVEHMTSRPAPPGGAYKKLSQQSETEVTSGSEQTSEPEDNQETAEK